MGPPRTPALLLATLTLLSLGCAGPTTVTIHVTLGASASEPEQLRLSAEAGGRTLVDGLLLPEDGGLPELPGSIVLRLPPEEAQLSIAIAGLTGGTLDSAGMGTVTVRPRRNTDVDVELLGFVAMDMGVDAGVLDLGVDAPVGVDSGATDSGSDGGAPPPSAWCGGGALIVVTTAEDEWDGGGSASSEAMVGGAVDVSLREAITIANNRAGPDEIRFDPAVFPPGASTLVVVGSGVAGPTPLPAITGQQTCIDGAGAGAVIEGDALLPAMSDGMQVAAGDVVIANLTIVDFPNAGIRLMGGSIGVRVVGCTLGLLGGVPTGNSDGIVVSSAAQAVLIGPGNVLAGNSDDGVDISGGDGHRIFGNWIGVNTALNLGVGNGDNGIAVLSGNGIEIGGPLPADANYIGGNGDNGIVFHGAGVTALVIRGNFIGSDASFAANFGNTNSGVEAYDLASGTVGPDNVIGFNDEGVQVREAGTSVTITANAIAFNFVAIELLTGGNGGLAAPVITAADMSMVSGSSVAPNGSMVEVFTDTGGQAQCPLGTTVVGGVGTWSLPGPFAGPCGSFFTATVTDSAGNTSPVSAPFP